MYLLCQWLFSVPGSPSFFPDIHCTWAGWLAEELLRSDSMLLLRNCNGYVWACTRVHFVRLLVPFLSLNDYSSLVPPCACRNKETSSKQGLEVYYLSFARYQGWLPAESYYTMYKTINVGKALSLTSCCSFRLKYCWPQFVFLQWPAWIHISAFN